MRQYPRIVCVTEVVKKATKHQTELSDGRWVPARALGFMSFGQRVKAAWLVFTGKADALTWPGQ